ncbi:uncharacterized protein LOC110676555 [Aedes aegypti]|uniref:Uncharacterized protein n=1 Tax=Aedes aegypti TaxID=7159 RepID=A0A6I8U058_AEDAE|nr:uncharacterized protein LOC110676555 [Aedes aegypti]
MGDNQLSVKQDSSSSSADQSEPDANLAMSSGNATTICRGATSATTPPSTAATFRKRWRRTTSFHRHRHKRLPRDAGDSTDVMETQSHTLHNGNDDSGTANATIRLQHCQPPSEAGNNLADVTRTSSIKHHPRIPISISTAATGRPSPSGKRSGGGWWSFVQHPASSSSTSCSTSWRWNFVLVFTVVGPLMLLSCLLSPVLAAKSGQSGIVISSAAETVGVDEPVAAAQKQSRRQCAMSEHSCNNGRCVPLNKYCNNVNDCGDGSDEPRFCTRCNRTYYGNIGLTYDLELHRPKEDRIPYVCILTFTAAGGNHGDIVQITLDSFTLGKFVSYTENGCPDGYLQVAEASRTPVGGMWCGTTWGPATFFSETRSLVMTVKLLKLSRDQSGYNFDFRIKYKMLSRDSAVVRYGGIKNEPIAPWTNVSYIPNYPIIDDFTNSTAHSEKQFSGQRSGSSSMELAFDNSTGRAYGGSFGSGSIGSGGFFQSQNRERPYSIRNLTSLAFQPGGGAQTENYTEPKYYLGDLMPGTYCSRIFTNCDKKACRLQSPNFPGVYPRNLTCYFAVRQEKIAAGF